MQRRLDVWLAVDAFRAVWAACVLRYETPRGIDLDRLSIDGSRKPAKKGRRGRPLAPLSPVDRGKGGTQLVLVSAADDFPVGA